MNFITQLIVLFHEKRMERLRLIHEQRMELKICQSCEITKIELARAHELNKRLIESLTVKPEVVETKLPQVSPVTNLPWRARKQILEQEDRQLARARAQAPKPIISGHLVELDINELEKELGVSDA